MLPTWGHIGVYLFVCSYAKGGGDLVSHVNIHTYTYACTYSI